jgi:hypothetical protein
LSLRPTSAVNKDCCSAFTLSGLAGAQWNGIVVLSGDTSFFECSAGCWNQTSRTLKLTLTQNLLAGQTYSITFVVYNQALQTSSPLASFPLLAGCNFPDHPFENGIVVLSLEFTNLQAVQTSPYPCDINIIQMSFRTTVDLVREPSMSTNSKFLQ